MIRMPAPRTRTCSVLRRSKLPTRQTSRYPTAALKRPHRTLTVEKDNPTPGGDANGLWKAALRFHCPSGVESSPGKCLRRNTTNSGTSAFDVPFRSAKLNVAGLTEDRPDRRATTYRKLALRNFCRKSSPSILITRHISCRRDRMRSPMRSPSVSARVAARTGETEPLAPAAA
jgi:hypothetical protein